MTEEQFSMMVDDASPKIREIRAEVIEMVLDSLESIAANLAEDKANRLWDLFGRDFLSPPRSEFQWNQIQCLPSSGPWNQLIEATTVVLGDDLKFSRSQIADLIPLRDKEFVNRLNNRINENEISDQLDQILSKSQRSAIVQRLQRGALVSDMKVLLTPEVGKHVGLEKEEEELIVKVVNEATDYCGNGTAPTINKYHAQRRSRTASRTRRRRMELTQAPAFDQREAPFEEPHLEKSLSKDVGRKIANPTSADCFSPHIFRQQSFRNPKD
jgi:hypothetical protein